MQMIFPASRSPKELRLIEGSLRRQWTVESVFQNSSECGLGNEEARLKWAQALVSLAFGESTAFHGFGKWISHSGDVQVKFWLAIHLLDEARHSEGFTALLNYFFPSYKNRQNELFANRHAYLFYGLTERTEDLTQWLICTQLAEVFGRECYRELSAKFANDPTAHKFFTHIVADEVHHVAYVSSILDSQRKSMGEELWQSKYVPFIEKMMPLCRNMFEAKKKGGIYSAFEALEISSTEFCNRAETSLQRFVCA